MPASRAARSSSKATASAPSRSRPLKWRPSSTSCRRLPRSPRGAARSRCTARPSCASRRAIASRRWSQASARSGSAPRSGPTASRSAVRRGPAGSPTRKAIIGWRWPLPSPRSRPPGRRRSKAPTQSGSRIRTFSTPWTGSSREGGQGVPRRVHGGRQDDSRARARQAPRLAGGGHRRAHRAARASVGRRHLRPARRSLLPRRRAGGAPGADAGAPPRGRHRRRDLRRSPEPGRDQQRWRVGVARRAARTRDRADAGRRPPSAGRRPRRIRAPLSRAARGLSVRARPARRRTRERGRAGRAVARLAGELMRYLVLTDIHANLEALDACIADARTRGFDRALVLGDLVGYGADPNAVIERVQALDPLAIVRGNHDKVACGLEQAEDFNSVAKSAAHWTFDVMTPEHRAWLAALPEGPIRVDDLVEICHGSPFDEDAYIFDELDAVRALKASQRPLCLFGHTHYPVSFELSADTFDSTGPSASAESQLVLRNGSKYLVNPGSVGRSEEHT